MLVHVRNVLTTEEVAHCRTRLEASEWVDGRVTAGAQAARAKNNLQIPEDAPIARDLGDLILRALGRSPLFNAAALPLRVLPPLFNRYDVGMGFGAHVDGAVRMVPGAGIRMRADVSTTLFLTEPDAYDGGELVIEDTFGAHSLKLPAGDMIVYPATSLHRVEPITRGSRWSAFFWSQSMVKDDGQRALLFAMDQGITGVRQKLSDEDPAAVALTSCYHNLLRRWAEM
ncbi:Fe(II)-dependent oxygenase [Methylobacterium variabile]|jgi:PKHD-type hydroxylase|uniref:Fe(II)-dependent oxygenase n=1 Tax=Methylobacterium variabile TaxID=298794 RepID=A0A0J6T2I0_9HYPH|nr:MULTISPECIES: Fe2+-dependent dioxygenase [Methylobacterium]KMO41605.1 Fe(II)-dependent oxygenase [Methylobacterium variabile]NGM37369.1 Fe2+-dependent dioxygenase [Methylobacterium sp. DB0501]UHC20277.1 Fe2+-dependent dioxygenase [Methylobacterium currus]